MRYSKSKILKTSLYFLIVGTIFFSSLFISPLYTLGDQQYYNNVYNEVSKLPIRRAFALYSASLDSKEIIHFILVWISSRFISREIFIAIMNSLFAFASVLVLRSYKVNWLVLSFIVIPNYYWVVLYFSAERLKIAFFFFLLAVLFKRKNKKYVWIFILLSVLAHAQFLILYASIMILIIWKKIIVCENIKLNKKTLIISLLIVATVIWLLPQIGRKASVFLTFRNVSELYKGFVFFILSFIMCRKFNIDLVVFFPLLFFILFFGGTRLNIFAFVFFLYFSLRNKHKNYLMLMFVLVYYARNGLEFIKNILQYGTGYI